MRRHTTGLTVCSRNTLKPENANKRRLPPNYTTTVQLTVAHYGEPFTTASSNTRGVRRVPHMVGTVTPSLWTPNKMWAAEYIDCVSIPGAGYQQRGKFEKNSPFRIILWGFVSCWWLVLLGRADAQQTPTHPQHQNFYMQYSTWQTMYCTQAPFHAHDGNEDNQPARCVIFNPTKMENGAG